MRSLISRSTPAPANSHRLRRDTAGKPYVIMKPMPTGLEILTLANLLPGTDYTLRVKAAGEPPQKVGLDEQVDLRKKGVEKFKALPRDQTEG